MTEQKISMTTVTDVLEKLRIEKHDKEFRMTPEGFTPGNNKYYNPEDLKKLYVLTGLKVSLTLLILRLFI